MLQNPPTPEQLQDNAKAAKRYFRIQERARFIRLRAGLSVLCEQLSRTARALVDTTPVLTTDNGEVFMRNEADRMHAWIMMGQAMGLIVDDVLPGQSAQRIMDMHEASEAKRDSAKG